MQSQMADHSPIVGLSTPLRSEPQPLAGSSAGGPVSEAALAAAGPTTNSPTSAPTRSSGRARQPSQKIREDQRLVPTAARSASASASGSAKPKRRPSTGTDNSSTSTNNSTSPKQSTNIPQINNKLTLNRSNPRPGHPEVGGQESVGPVSRVPPLIDSPPPQTRTRWTQAEDLRLIGLIRIKPSLSWGEISGRLGTGPGGDGSTRPAQGCMIRW